VENDREDPLVNPQQPKRTRRILRVPKRPELWIFVVAVVVHFFWELPVFLHPDRIFAPDSYLYHKLALNLNEKHAFTGDFPVENAPEVFRTPGYPFFLALIYRIFGPHPMAVVVIQVLFGTWIPVLVYRAFGQVLPRTPVFWGSILLSVMPEFAIFSSFLMTETLYEVVVAIALFFLFAPFITGLASSWLRLESWPSRLIFGLPV